ncbi:hypothetical protein DNTS_026890 [Danionella cerebrum]|uniref:BTB domain-containing protein n=1 Tax=Danionella cerebrum TaxID=2873325 RepID=A0A553QE39_9TELE|nr:hypothetical protein DNTS_026890 [Danionella translucida]TRY88199.1 hypothetical protein DNTS_026890 [Danionella translucida]
MASVFTSPIDDASLSTKLSSGLVNGVGASASSSSLYEVIGGSLYRKKLEKGFVQYREVLGEDKRLHSIANFHEKRPGKSHHTLEDTYRLVAEHYWWEGMYFQVRDFVFGCEVCQGIQSEKSVCSDVGLISRMVESHSHEVLNKLNSQRETGLFCDITLKTGGGNSFVAHKAVLAAVSEYFQELFTEMDSATDPQQHVDLTGFSEQCLLALLEFCYTSTLNLDLDNMTEVCAMARHLRMWPALEACSAIKREQETWQLGSMHCSHYESGHLRKGHSSTFDGKLALNQKRQFDDGEVSGLSYSIQAQYKEHTVGKVMDESETDTSKPEFQYQVPSSFQVEENGFPCSPTRRMKLMDFKSPFCKKKSFVISKSPCTSTRSSSPSRRLLRSSPGAALALRRLLPKIDLSTKRKKKTLYHVYKPHHFSGTTSQSQANTISHINPVKVKEEDVEEDINKSIPQEEVHSPRAQEKYRLLGFLGLQRKSLVPGPEELSGWGQKKRLRKLKVSDYSLTTRRKPRVQGTPLNFGTSLGVLAAVNPTLSLCDMSRMDLLNRPMKLEPQESWTQQRSKRKRHDSLQTIVRTTRSRSLLQMESSGTDRTIGSHITNHGKAPSSPVQRGRRTAHSCSSPSKNTITKIKQEFSDSAILQPIHRRNTVCSPKRTAPKVTGCRGRPPADRTVRAATTKSQKHKPRPAQRDKSKKSKPMESRAKNTHATGMPQGKRTRTERGTQVKENRKVMETGNRKKSPELQYNLLNWGPPNNQNLYNHPLYKTIKEEPADPLPLTQQFPMSDPLDLGKRQSKPPVKLLDQGFLFGLCRQPSGIKREEDSMDIYVTKSFSHGSSSTPDKKDRIRARIMPDRTGLNGPHWAGLGNRHSPFSQRSAVRVKTEKDETALSKDKPFSKQPQVSKKSCKVKKQPTEMKLCSKTFFRQRNVRNHIRTHNPKLYKCRQCIAA